MIRRDTLERCAGYNAVYPDGHLGFVELVLHNEKGDVTGLGVVCGLFATRFVLVPVDEIAHVDPRARRVTLFETPKGGPEHFEEFLRGHAHVDAH